MARIGDGLLLNIFFYNGLFGLLLMPVYWLWLRFDIADFQPTRIGFGMMLAIVLLWFAFITLPTQPLSLIVLPICLALVLWGLWRNRQAEAPLQKSKVAAIPFHYVLPVLLIPLVSSLFYAAALIIGLTLPSLAIVLVITTPAGFFMLGMALWKFGRTTQPQTNP